jgi:hypothetical protein
MKMAVALFLLQREISKANLKFLSILIAIGIE